MVVLHTNKEEYRNDIAEVIRAYLGMVEIRPDADGTAPEGYTLEVELFEGPQPHVTARGRKVAGLPAAVYARNIDLPYDSLLLRKRQEKRALKIAAFRVLRQLEPETVLPWGSLTGIRPTKLLRELAEDVGEAEACRMFREEFDVHPEKTALAASIVRAQRDILLSAQPKDVDVYIGIPFCKTRCLYCSFASEVVGDRGVPEPYLNALFRDIQLGAQLMREGGYRIRSTYVGGGTPTVLSADQLRALLSHAQSCYGGFGLELTVEAGRPDTIDRNKLCVLREMGVGRISLNPQSMQAQTLVRIGREHTPEDILSAYRLARDTGFNCINMDIIAGLPGETIEDVRRTLDSISALAPENLTVHTLAVKRSSRLKEQIEAYPLPSPEEADRMVTLGEQCAAGLGMHPYYMYRQKYMRGNLENVGYALPDKDCIYNIDMMEEATNIIAHGAGAMTKRVFLGRDLRVERIPAPKDIATYMEKLVVLDAQKRALFLDA